MPGQSADERREALKEVFREARGCTRCPQLAATRHTVVFGAGNADADLMFVGEAPGANEDRQGLPFVGQAGGLLDELLAGVGLRREDVFITNVLNCLRYDAPVQLATAHGSGWAAWCGSATPGRSCPSARTANSYRGG
jgi:uracil-DNA glycosylase